MQRITIYGFAINDDPVHGWGSGVLIDLVYFIEDDHVSVSDIFGIIENAGYKMRPKWIVDNNGKAVHSSSGKKIAEQDRVMVEDWNAHIKVGTERLPSQSYKDNLTQYNRYNYPYGGGM
jgi:hypothetical protein